MAFFRTNDYSNSSFGLDDLKFLMKLLLLYKNGDMDARSGAIAKHFSGKFSPKDIKTRHGLLHSIDGTVQDPCNIFVFHP